jgi:peptide/nickel transport system permease protein
MNNNLVKYCTYQVLRVISLLLAVCLGAFTLLSLSPFDPIQAYVGADSALVTPAQAEKIACHWGLNDPPPQRFGKWLSAVVHGDFGISMIYRKPVLEIIREKFSASFILMGIAWSLSGILGFSLGIVAAMQRGKWLDRMIKWLTLTLASTPTFWFGLVILMIFAVKLGWFPIGLGVPVGLTSATVSWAERLYHMILPAITLSIIGVANIAQHTREKMIDVLETDYILYAKARGESRWTLLYRHGLRNILLPAVTLQFASFNELFGGSILAEQVFAYPGLGQAVVNAGIKGDVPLLLGITLFSSIFVFLGNLTANLIYGWVDPQIKESGVNG